MGLWVRGASWQDLRRRTERTFRGQVRALMDWLGRAVYDVAEEGV
jgi:hypothetical protein